MKNLEKYIKTHDLDLKRISRDNAIKERMNSLIPITGLRFGQNTKRFETVPIRFGEKNDGLCFYIIRTWSHRMGTFELWFEIAFYISYAIKHGYIPYIHMRDEWNPLRSINGYSYEGEDRWGRSFRQPQNVYDLDIIGQSQKVLFNTPNKNPYWYPFNRMYFEEARRQYHSCYNLIGPNDSVVGMVGQYHIPSNTIGIPIRREFERGRLISDVFYTNWHGHRQLGCLDDYVRLAHDLLESGLYDNIFLTCDDREAVKTFSREFGSNCIHFDRRLPRFFSDGKPAPANSKDIYVEFDDLDGLRERFEVIEKEYIAETILMSKCSAIIGTPSAQVLMARVISEDDIPVIDTSILLKMF